MRRKHQRPTDAERARDAQDEVEELILDERFRLHIPLPLGRRRIGRARRPNMKVGQLAAKLGALEDDRATKKLPARARRWWQRLLPFR